jgi:hypothetical protein
MTFLQPKLDKDFNLGGSGRTPRIHSTSLAKIIVVSSVVDPDPYPDWIRIQRGPESVSGFAIRIRIQEGKNDPEKEKTVNKFIF